MESNLVKLIRWPKPQTELLFNAQVESLLRAQADVNDEVNGDTPLDWAVYRGCSLVVIEMLLSYGAQVNHRDSLDIPPFLHAASFGTVPILQCLIRCRADAYATKRNVCCQFTALDLALCKQNSPKEVVAFLFTLGLESTQCPNHPASAAVGKLPVFQCLETTPLFTHLPCVLCRVIVDCLCP